MDFSSKKSVPNPLTKASIISYAFLWWLFPLLRKGAVQDLNINDLFDVLKEDESGILGKQLTTAWEAECLERKKRNLQPRFYKALLKVFFWTYFRLGLTSLASECLLRMAQTVCLHRLIISFDDGSPARDQYLYGTGIILCTFFYNITLHPCLFGVLKLGMQMRVAACSLMYRKALRLSKASQGQATVGQLVNLMSNDVNRFDMNLVFLHHIIAAPAQLCILTVILWTEAEFEATSLSAAAFLIFLIPFQYYNSWLFAKFRLETAKRTDKRGHIMNEIIMAIRVIKMYAWEKPFSALVDEIRRLEVQILRKSAFLRAMYLSLYMSASKVIVFLVILTFILTGGVLKASNVFFLVTASNILRLTMVFFIPNAAAHIGELGVAITRIEEYLLLSETKPFSWQAIELPSGLGSREKKQTEAAVSLTNAFANWSKDRPTLEDFTLNLRGDKLVMVVGPVGSGKTSFLHALISEIPITQGKCVVSGTTAFACQEPWIFSGNLRQNILFGRAHEKSRYADVIEASALAEDLKQFPLGENTVVGERGTALSGGQKARLNLARALYQEADIYLLDDPLSAVDTRVSRHIFEKCVQGFLRGKLRILATHQLQYLPRADHIIVLNKGKILAEGSYTQLVQQGIDFVGLLTEDEDERRRASVSSEKEAEVKVEGNPLGKPAEKNEKMVSGSVKANTFYNYFRAGGSIFEMFILATGFLLSQLLYSAADYWLSFWTSKAVDSVCEEEEYSLTTTMNPCGEPFDHHLYFYVYSGIVAGVFLVTTSVAVYYFMYCMSISVNIHDKMFKSMVRAPVKFYDDNPSGRIMNRFTKDIGSIDEMLPPAFYDALTNFLLMIGSVVVVISANYFLAIPAAFLIVGLVVIRRFYVKTARDVKRIEAMGRSPIYTHLAATMQGLSTIRSSGSENILIDQFDSLQDCHSAGWFAFIAASRWFGIWLEMISLGFLICVTYGFMALSSLQNFDGSQVGLAISSCLGLSGVFQWGMRQSAETENLMTSVERALEYANLTSEAPLDSKPDKKPPKNWPSTGSIQFRNVHLCYEDVDVLKNLSFNLGAKEKVGIVGRTGAGKSTVISALFRLTEPTGEILVDNIRVSEIGLHDLRKSISIIPQDPVLFSGTIRYNLDPFGNFKDDEIWKVLHEVRLGEAVEELDFEVAGGGSNFSVGQRQLVCLARAILRNNRILIMDEATANVDPETDVFIQSTIRTKFAECTIVTIAHRLHSVMGCDKILVLDHGVLMEHGHPHILLQNSDGILSSMVDHTGAANSLVLRQMAKEGYEDSLTLHGNNATALTQVGHTEQGEERISVGQDASAIETKPEDFSVGVVNENV